MIDRLVTGFFRFYAIILFAFIFAPFVTLVAFAFNTSRFPYLPWQGFTLDCSARSTTRRSSRPSETACSSPS